MVTPPVHPAPAAPARRPASAPPSASGRSAWIRGSLAYAALVAMAAAGGALLLGGDGGGRWADRLSFLQRPFTELESAYRGDGVSPGGAEYVVFTGRGGEPSLRNYLQGHASVRYVSAGLLPGVSVVRILGDVKPTLADLNRQPYVEMVLKARVGMVCH